jgi:glutathione peroxidase-family protein
MTSIENYLNSEHAVASEVVHPISLYDIPIASSDGKVQDILANRKGKVTLVFNVAAGCGNIPQHGIIEKLNQRYKNEPDFDIIAIVVDDFQCHGYKEFQDGIASYCTVNNIDMSVGEFAKKYAEENFGTTFEFSELTNGRVDKVTYESDFVPNTEISQTQNTLWYYLTEGYNATLNKLGVPYTGESVPWSGISEDVPKDAKRAFPITGNFTKFLIDRTGTKTKRYSNGFLLGERDVFGEIYPWLDEKFLDNGEKDWKPFVGPKDDGEPWIDPQVKEKGVDVSLDLISLDIDEYLGLN